MNTSTEICALCPQLCRHRCPVSVGSGREAATPTAMLGAVMLAQQGHADSDVAARAIDLCTGCGACTDVCGIDAPVIDLLREARSSLQDPPAAESLERLSGSALQVAVICGDQDWSSTLSRHKDMPLASIRTSDHLGELCLMHNATRSAHLDAIHQHFDGRSAIVSCHGCLSVLQAAQVEVIGLWSLITLSDQTPSIPVCRQDPPPHVSARLDLACCGAGNPLASRHPEVAQEVGRGVARRLSGQPTQCIDSRCAAHLRTCGATVSDPIQALIELEEKCP